uniref:Uncharacterized protein n=1 Tax=Oryza punctata TaxID=4537 RepID=A0A0E0KRQ2_ORYPU
MHDGNEVLLGRDVGLIAPVHMAHGSSLVLQRRGVFVHGLGNHYEVADLFANLCKDTVFDFNEADENYLRPVCQALERRFRSRPRRWMASLKQKHFLNPWLAAGLVVATVRLVCTVIQTVYSVLSYIKAGNSWAC